MMLSNARIAFLSGREGRRCAMQLCMVLWMMGRTGVVAAGY